MSATEWKFVPVEPTSEQRLAVCMHPDLAAALYRSMIKAAPVPPSIESLLENWTPSDQQAFATFLKGRFPAELDSYAIQSLGSAWKDGQANASPEVPQCTGTGSDSLDCILGVGGFASFGPLDAQPAAHLTIPGALEWDGDNGTHSADGESRDDGESALLAAAGEHVEEHLSKQIDILTINLNSVRAQLASTEQSRRSFFDLSKDLEKRLAERDALLRRCLMAVREQHCDEGEADFDLPATLMAEIDAALSSIVEPGKCESCGDWGHIETEDSAHDCPECGPSVIERAVEAGVMNAPKQYAADDIPDFTPGSGNKAKRRIAAIEAAKQKTCIECDQPHCPGVCVERGDQDYDRDQAAKGGCDE